MKNDRCLIYGNYAFSITKLLSARKPDVLLVHGKKTIYVIEFSSSAERNIPAKEMHRGFSVKLMVMVIGVLGGMKSSFFSNLRTVPGC